MIRKVSVKLYKIRVFKNKKYKKRHENIFHEKRTLSCENYILNRF